MYLLEVRNTRFVVERQERRIMAEQGVSKEWIEAKKEQTVAAIVAINDFIAHSNCSDFMIKHYDGSRLYLIGSFDLCYYSEIILFEEVGYLSMSTVFSLWDLQKEAFQVKFGTDDEDNLFEIQIHDDYEKKVHIIRCDGVRAHIGIQGLDESVFRK